MLPFNFRSTIRLLESGDWSFDSQNISDAENKFVLPLYDVNKIKKRLEARAFMSNGLFGTIVNIASKDIILGLLLDPSGEKNQNLTHVCRSRLTAQEIDNCLA